MIEMPVCIIDGCTAMSLCAAKAMDFDANRDEEGREVSVIK